jgi:hypothetical protein
LGSLQLERLHEEDEVEEEDGQASARTSTSGGHHAGVLDEELSSMAEQERQ